mmetsp:Transcript_32772/g.82258  ORF Transcript_32772/g.82258 Transcript_32772/m.82258 type:complete len:275 (+) Transcript_32772:1121-1945(+)
MLLEHAAHIFLVLLAVALHHLVELDELALGGGHSADADQSLLLQVILVDAHEELMTHGECVVLPHQRRLLQTGGEVEVGTVLEAQRQVVAAGPHHLAALQHLLEPFKHHRHLVVQVHLHGAHRVCERHRGVLAAPDLKDTREHRRLQAELAVVAAGDQDSHVRCLHHNFAAFQSIEEQFVRTRCGIFVNHNGFFGTIRNLVFLGLVAQLFGGLLAEILHAVLFVSRQTTDIVWISSRELGRWNLAQRFGIVFFSAHVDFSADVHMVLLFLIRFV